MTALPQDQPEAGQGRSHLVDAAVAFGLRVASAGLVFMVQVFLARAMSMDDYGSYITAWTWLVMLGAFMPLGFSESAVRFVPRYRAHGRHGSAAAFWRFGLRVVLLMSLLVAGFAVIAATAGGHTNHKYKKYTKNKASNLKIHHHTSHLDNISLSLPNFLNYNLAIVCKFILSFFFFEFFYVCVLWCYIYFKQCAILRKSGKQKQKQKQKKNKTKK